MGRISSEGKEKIRVKKGRLTPSHGCVGYWNVGLDKGEHREKDEHVYMRGPAGSGTIALPEAWYGMGVRGNLPGSQSFWKGATWNILVDM